MLLQDVADARDEHSPADDVGIGMRKEFSRFLSDADSEGRLRRSQRADILLADVVRVCVNNNVVVLHTRIPLCRMPRATRTNHPTAAIGNGGLKRPRVELRTKCPPMAFPSEGVETRQGMAARSATMAAARFAAER